MRLSLHFLSPVQLRSGSGRAALGGTWPSARVSPPGGSFCLCWLVSARLPGPLMFPSTVTFPCLLFLLSLPTYSIVCTPVHLNKPYEANKITLSVLPSQNQAAWALMSRCLEVVDRAQKPFSFLSPKVLLCPEWGKPVMRTVCFSLCSNLCNFGRGADVYLQEITEAEMWGLINTDAKASCCPHPMPLFSWKIVGLDTF